MWQKVTHKYALAQGHHKRYPYLGECPKHGNYYVWHEEGEKGDKGMVVVFFEKKKHHWEIGCSFHESFRGIHALKACQEWLNCHKINYQPLRAKCLRENKAARWFAKQLGFRERGKDQGWVILGYEGN